MDTLEIRNERFYTELILITVVVLVTANLWVYTIETFLKKYYPKNFRIPLIMAIITTFLSIIILSNLFGKTSNHPKITSTINLEKDENLPYN